jgi:hypothetical protein
MEISQPAKAVFLLKTKQSKLTITAAGTIAIDNGDQPVVIAGPGEYEVKGFSLIGHKDGGYVIEAEEIKVGYKTAKEEVDVLITDSWDAAKESQPSIVIPLTQAAGEELAKASGLEKKIEKKLSLNKLSLSEETELVILETKG